MQDAVERSLAAMKWLTTSDGAAVELARLTAAQVDLLSVPGNTSLLEKKSRASASLLRVLHELGGTPAVRLQHELRSMRAGIRSATSGTAIPAGENVSKFQRPRKSRPRL
ncbi:terminase small subunit [Mycetocola manganoxydans]